MSMVVKMENIQTTFLLHSTLHSLISEYYSNCYEHWSASQSACSRAQRWDSMPSSRKKTTQKIPKSLQEMIYKGRRWQHAICTHTGSKSIQAKIEDNALILLLSRPYQNMSSYSLMGDQWTFLLLLKPTQGHPVLRALLSKQVIAWPSSIISSVLRIKCSLDLLPLRYKQCYQTSDDQTLCSSIRPSDPHQAGRCDAYSVHVCVTCALWRRSVWFLSPAV